MLNKDSLREWRAILIWNDRVYYGRKCMTIDINLSVTAKHLKGIAGIFADQTLGNMVLKQSKVINLKAQP